MSCRRARENSWTIDGRPIAVFNIKGEFSA